MSELLPEDRKALVIGHCKYHLANLSPIAELKLDRDGDQRKVLSREILVHQDFAVST